MYGENRLKTAYDSLEWPFLEGMLGALGFPSTFIQWVMACVTSVNYIILVNGVPTPRFHSCKGLRQGDPMSPCLFAIGMEYLSRCLNTLKIDPRFSFHPKCKRVGLISLLFADDLLIFSQASQTSVQVVRQQFLHFSQVSRLQANLRKSEIYVAG